VVISPRAYNERIGLALLCPLTTSAKRLPFEVAVPEGLPTNGVVLSNQLRSLNWRARRAEYICELPRLATVDILVRIRTLAA
jgi:mRNA interferase MazF